MGDSLNRYTVTSELRFNDLGAHRSSAAGRFAGHAVTWRTIVVRASTCLLAAAVAAGLQAAENISVLGNKPRWDVLEHYQQTITRDEFAHLIDDVYATHGFAADLIEIKDDTARILTNRDAQQFFTLRFASTTEEQKSVPRLWRPAKSLRSAGRDKPLAGLKVALDPGHLGGSWAKMEERWFRAGDNKPVQEGDLTLCVARLLAARLRQLGAKVSFVRNDDEPTTAKRADDFRNLAKKILIKNGVPPEYAVAFCPMYKGGASWVQKKGPIVNPYTGKSMPGCGTFKSKS